MKAYVRVKYVGEETLNFGVHGKLTPGTEFSMSYKDVEYMENSNDGMPKYFEKVGESNDKEPKKLCIMDDIDDLSIDALKKVAKKEKVKTKGCKTENDLKAVIRAARLQAAQAEVDKDNAEAAEAKKRPEGAGMTPSNMFQDPSKPGAPTTDAAGDGDEDPDDDAGDDDPDEDSEGEGQDDVPPYLEWKLDELRDELTERKLKVEGRLTKAKAAEVLDADDDANPDD